LGIDIQTLPAAPLEERLWDRSRGQLVAERVLTMIRQRYPEHVADPSATVIGLTTEDMYIQQRSWGFAFAYRGTDRLAIVSSARMDPASEDL
jgi:predicted Zn-dependent protease